MADGSGRVTETGSNLRNYDAVPHVGSLLRKPNLAKFRVAGRLAGVRSGKTLARGGFGIFDVLPLPSNFNLISLAVPSCILSSPILCSPACFQPAPFNNSVINEFRACHLREFNPNQLVNPVESGIAGELVSLAIGYVRLPWSSRSVLRVDTNDMVLPTLDSTGYVLPPTANVSSPLLNSNFCRINSTLWQSQFFYHALQRIWKRVKPWSRIARRYTWGKVLTR